jgi:protein involved in polysaccharide export with SLBB domain
LETVGDKVGGKGKGADATIGQQRTYDSANLQKPVVETKVHAYEQVFGSEIFSNNNLTFEPNLRMATPKNYTLGPDDELVLDVFGYQELNVKMQVSTEGSINIPNIGIVPVIGLSIEQATKRIKDRMARGGYQTLQSGQSQLQVSLGKIRNIKVTIIGEAKRPGSYTLPSLAQVFNALYAAGGPTERGSFRKIEVIRNSKVIATIDAYDFLLNGNQTRNVRLQDQDVVRVPIADVQVTLKGEVKRQGIYEVLPNESFAQILNYAGGFTPLAYKASVHVQQYGDKEMQIKDVAKEAFVQYQPIQGDVIEVGKLLNRFNNRISLIGDVYRPGDYELTNGLTVGQLIKKADGVLPSALLQRGLIVRTNNDLTKEVIAFHVANILNGSAPDVLLKKDDEVTIASEKDYKDIYSLQVDGEVRKPGVYPYYNGITLKDLLFQTGGFTDAASIKHIEVARRLHTDSAHTKQIAEVIEIETEKDLSDNTKNLPLQPWDMVSIRTKPGYKRQLPVYISGEVTYPGKYVLVTNNEHVSEIIKRCGGLTPQAFLQGASLVRQNTNLAKDTGDARLRKIQQQLKDTGNLTQDYLKTTIKVGLDLKKILENPLGIEDVVLQEGDVLSIPKEKREIKVSGEVMLPSEIVYKRGESLDYYIGKAGGFTDNARKAKVYVLYPNGSGARIKRFLFFWKYPRVTEGAEILVPANIEKHNKGLTTAEVIGLTSALASMAGVVIAILRR